PGYAASEKRCAHSHQWSRYSFRSQTRGAHGTKSRHGRADQDQGEQESRFPAFEGTEGIRLTPRNPQAIRSAAPRAALFLFRNGTPFAYRRTARSGERNPDPIQSFDVPANNRQRAGNRYGEEQPADSPDQPPKGQG